MAPQSVTPPPPARLFVFEPSVHSSGYVNLNLQAMQQESCRSRRGLKVRVGTKARVGRAEAGPASASVFVLLY
jgi:hypothetical protein